jgi:LacI family transcriptional regulator
MVLVLSTWKSQFGRGVTSGVIRCLREHSIWRFQCIEPRPAAVAEAAAFKPVGVVASVFDKEMTHALRRLRAPVVDVGACLEPPVWPQVRTDDAAIGRLAAEHLREMRLGSFVFAGGRGTSFAKLRGEAFARTLAGGGDCTWVELTDLPQAYGPQGEVAPVLRRLKKPIGVFCVHDGVSYRVSLLCHKMGLRVPEDVAIIGVDNDEIVCRWAVEPLSSIATPSEAIGYAAGEMLMGLLAGKAPQNNVVVVPPGRVAARESTDLVVVRDADVSRAVAFMREHLQERIGIKQVVDRLGVKRRTLEAKFRQSLDRTPYQEMMRIRLRRVQELLAETDMTMTQIAQQTGFAGGSHLIQCFSRAFGCTPQAFRERCTANA